MTLTKMMFGRITLQNDIQQNGIQQNDIHQKNIHQNNIQQKRTLTVTLAETASELCNPNFSERHSATCHSVACTINVYDRKLCSSLERNYDRTIVILAMAS